MPFVHDGGMCYDAVTHAVRCDMDAVVYHVGNLGGLL